MRDNKAFASLTSGLLARKGQARPAMRAQGFGFGSGKLDDLGWNDMGHDVPAPAAIEPTTVRLREPKARPHVATLGRAEVPPVVRQQEEIAEALAAPVEIAPPPVLAPPVLAPVVDLTPPVVEATPEVVAEALAVPAHQARARPKRARRVAAEPVAARPPVVRAPREAGRKAAFTLRIEAERHLRLRLACAVQNRSAQQIVTAALDRFLATLPDVERLVTSLSAPDAGQE